MKLVEVKTTLEKQNCGRNKISGRKEGTAKKKDKTGKRNRRTVRIKVSCENRSQD